MAGALAFGVGTATAATMDVGYQNPNDIFNGNAKGKVTIGVDGIRDPVRVYAGGFALQSDSEEFGEFIAWCLDVGANIFNGKSGQTHEYKVTDDPFSNTFFLTEQTQNNILRLFDAFYTEEVLTQANEATAFQVSLWTLVYADENSPAPLQAQNFSPSSAAALSVDWVNFVLDPDNVIQRRWWLHFLESTSDPRSQNLVTVTAIPLPAAGLLLFGALGGLGVIARLRRRTTA